MVAKTLGAIFGALAVWAAFIGLFGWLVAVCWNHFPFLQGVHNMGSWDGVVLMVLTSLLFKQSAGVSLKA